MKSLDLIKEILLKIVDQIDSGSCNYSEEQINKALDMLKIYFNPEQKVSKEQACYRLGISRTTFDNRVRSGEYPRGKDQAGFKEKFWTNKDLSNEIK